MDVEIKQHEDAPTIHVNSQRVATPEGIKAIRKFKHWSRKDMAHYLKVSYRTVEGWEVGRTPNKSVLIALSYMLT